MRTCTVHHTLKSTNHRKHKTFCGHNILRVKFLWGEIFVGEGSPRKFNYHENLTPQTLTHKTKWHMKI